MVWNALRDLIVEIEGPGSESRIQLDFEEDHKSVLRIFVIIFLAELGDRSQFAIFALSTSHVRTRVNNKL